MFLTNNTIVTALESLEEQEQSLVAPATDTLVEKADEVLDATVAESTDIDHDVAALAEASTGLESIAETMIADGFDQEESAAPSALELVGINSALEAVNEEPAKEGESKKSVLERVQEGGKKALEWLVNMARNILNWITENLTRAFKPMNTFVARAEAVAAKDTLNDKFTIPVELAKKLATSAGVVGGLKQLTNFTVSATKAADPKKAEQALEAIRKGEAADITKVFTELQSAYMPLYNQKGPNQGGKNWRATQEYIGGNTFYMDVDPANFKWDHQVFQDKDVEHSVKHLTPSDAKALAAQIKQSVVAAKAALDKTGAPSVLKAIQARVNTTVGKDKELSKEAKSLVYAIPKILKSPSLEAGLVLTRVMSAAVKFAEMHAKEAATAE